MLIASELDGNVTIEYTMYEDLSSTALVPMVRLLDLCLLFGCLEDHIGIIYVYLQ